MDILLAFKEEALKKACWAEYRSREKSLSGLGFLFSFSPLRDSLPYSMMPYAGETGFFYKNGYWKKKGLFTISNFGQGWSGNLFP